MLGCCAGCGAGCCAGRGAASADGISSHSSPSDKSAHRRPFPLPCLLCQCPGLHGRCCAASSEPRAAVRCGAGSPEPRAAWRSRCGVPSRGGDPRQVGGSLGGAGMGSSLGGGGCAGHCLSTGGGDALLALLVGIGPKRVRRASRSSPSSWAIFSAPRLRSALTRCSCGACIKAFNAVLVAIAWLCRAVRREKQEGLRI